MVRPALLVASALSYLLLSSCGTTEAPPQLAQPAAVAADAQLQVSPEPAGLHAGWVRTAPGARPAATFQLSGTGWSGAQDDSGAWRLERGGAEGAVVGFVAARQYRSGIDQTIRDLNAPGLTRSGRTDGTVAGAPSAQVTLTATQDVQPTRGPLAGLTLPMGSTVTVYAVFVRESTSAVFTTGPLGSTSTSDWSAAVTPLFSSLSLR